MKNISKLKDRKHLILKTLLLLAAIVIGLFLYYGKPDAPHQISIQKVAYSPPISNFNGDNKFIIDFPCTPKRSVKINNIKPQPDNPSYADDMREFEYTCNTTNEEDFSVTVDEFPSEYGPQQMDDIVHEFADNQISDGTYTMVLKHHIDFKGYDAFEIHYMHKEILQAKAVSFVGIYFIKGNTVYSIENDNEHHDTSHVFYGSFRIGQ